MLYNNKTKNFRVWIYDLNMNPLSFNIIFFKNKIKIKNNNLINIKKMMK